MKPVAVAIFASIATVTGALIAPKVSHATIIVDLTDQTATAPTRSFTQGDLTITVAPSPSSPQSFVASSGNGLCLYAESEDGVIRCGVGGPNPGIVYNSIQLTSNRDILFPGGNIFQFQGTPSPIDVTSSVGPSGVIPNTLGAFSFNTPIFVSSSQPVIFSGSGLNTSTRANSFTFEEVPGPLPVLGAAAAFGTSRRIRKKIKQLS